MIQNINSINASDTNDKGQLRPSLQARRESSHLEDIKDSTDAYEDYEAYEGRKK